MIMSSANEYRKMYKQRITALEQLPSRDPATSFEYIKKKLGEGTYGEVWKVRDRATGKILALKMIFKNRLAPRIEMDSIRDEPQTIFDAIRELEMLSRISSARNKAVGCHPGIVCYYDIFNCGDRLCITMEFVEGPTVEALLQNLEEKGKRLEPSKMYNFMMQSLTALAYIHSKGVAHRDIKGDNMILRNGTQVVFVDFGLTCFYENKTRSKSLYTCRGIAGSPQFMAPEVFDRQITKHRDWWPAADVWSLGIVFFELALGTSLPSALGEDVADGTITTVPKLAYKDPELAAIINSMLTLDPTRRPSAASLLARLSKYTPVSDSAASPQMRSVTSTPKSRKTRDVTTRMSSPKATQVLVEEEDEARPQALCLVM